MNEKLKINEISTKPCYIEIYCNDMKISSATGFQIHYNHKYLVTNWHVVSGRHFLTNKCLNEYCALPNKLIITYKKYVDDDKYEWTKTTINLFDQNGKSLWYEHPKYGHKIDVVVLPLEVHPHYKHHKERFELNTNYDLNVTEPVYVVGFPLGYALKSKDEPHAVWTSGIVASDPDLNILVGDQSLPAFLIDSRTRQGQSGSPVIYYSEVGLDLHYDGLRVNWGCPFMKEIGIYSGRINKESDLGYVWKWKVIKEIIDSIEIK